MKLTGRFILFIGLLAFLLAGGCATGPPYEKPSPEQEISFPGAR